MNIITLRARDLKMTNYKKIKKDYGNINNKKMDIKKSI